VTQPQMQNNTGRRISTSSSRGSSRAGGIVHGTIATAARNSGTSYAAGLLARGGTTAAASAAFKHKRRPQAWAACTATAGSGAAGARQH
jgi:hypothetical protein